MALNLARANPLGNLLFADLEVHGVFAAIRGTPDPTFGIEKVVHDGQSKLCAPIAQRVEHAVNVQVSFDIARTRKRSSVKVECHFCRSN